MDIKQMDITKDTIRADGSKAPEQIRADGDEMQKIAKELEEKYALWEELEEKQSLAN